MPDVGVLQLRISADAKSASASLRTLQTRLSEINNIAQNFNMSNVANQIGSIVKQVSANTATSTAVRNLGSLLNAISSFSKVTKIGLNKAQIEQIGALQQAVSGFNLGNSGTQLNKLREALGGEWNTDQAVKAREALETLSHGAKAISESGTADKIKDVSKSLENMTGSAVGNIKETTNDIVDYQKAVDEMGNSLKEAQVTFKEPIMKLNLQQFGGITDTDGFADSVSQIKEVSVATKEASTDMQGLKNIAEETTDAFNGIDISRMVQEVEQAANYMGLADKDIANETATPEKLVGGINESQQIAFNSIEEAARSMGISVEEAKSKLQETFNIVYNAPNGANTFTSIEQAANSLGLSVEEVRRQLQETYNMAYGIPRIGEAISNASQATISLNNMTSNSSVGIMNEGILDVAQSTAEYSGEASVAVAETEELKNSFVETMIGAEGLNGSFKRMFPAISGILSRFKNLVKYRMLRAVIKQIAEGFKEGTENYYKYSEAIGGSFAPAMDSAVSSLAQMKNSIGAAAAPVIQALIPYLQMAVNWFITAINYANQFFALLGGQTSWSRAVPQTAKAFDNVKKSAGGAGAAIKDLLADWDELNIIQSESGGGGGGGGASAMEDYLNMFEESSVFDEKIKKITDFIRENFDEIFDIIKKIGAALLLWKFSNAFTGLLGTLSGLVAAGLVGAIVFEVSTLFTNQYLESGDIGWLIADLLSTLLGSYFMKKILTKVLGGEVASLAIPITFTISAVAGIVTLLGNNDVSALSKEALITSAENGLKAAFAAGYLLKHFGGYTLAQAAGGGLGIGITTFGLVIGLKAIADTLDTKEFTSEIVKADFLSAGLVGTGIAITELALGGGAVAALTLGGGAALFTLAALFGIEALLTLSNTEDCIKWGDYDATEEEIKAFIDEEVFSGEPKAKISLAKATIEPLGENKAKLEEATTKVIGTLQSVKLGLSTSAEADLQSDIETFISTFNATSQNYQDALKISVSLVPVSNAEDGGESIIENSASRWGELNKIMTGLANDLTKQFDIAYSDGVDEVTKKDAELAIQKISEMMTRISDAISSGQAQAKIAHNLNTQIGNLTHDAMDEMLSYYEEQRDALIEELVNVGNEAAEGLLAQQYAYEKLAEYALKDANENIEDETYKYYIDKANEAKADYEARLLKLKEDAEEAADKTLGDTEGVKKIRAALLENITGELPQDIDRIFASAGIGDIDIYKAFMKELLQNIEKGDAEDTELKSEIENTLWGILYDLVGGENVSTYEKAIQDGLITYAELFGDIDVASILTEGLDIANMSDESRAIWEEVINTFFPDKPIKLPDKPIEIDATSLNDGLISGFEKVIDFAGVASSIYDEMVKERIREALSGFEPGLQRYGAEFDAVQGELVGLYGADAVESVMDELGLFDTTLPEMTITQPVDIDLETEQINSDIGSVLNNAMNGFASVFNFGDLNGILSSAFNFGDSNGILAKVISAAQQTLPSLSGGSGGGGMPFAGLPSDITITETRDSGEEIGNTAEGTRQGTSELVTGQNTMNGYMQQVAMSTAGMVDSQGTANSYMAQMVSLLRAIASQGGGGGMAPSVAGGVIAGAMKAFDMIRG